MPSSSAQEKALAVTRAVGPVTVVDLTLVKGALVRGMAGCELVLMLAEGQGQGVRWKRRSVRGNTLKDAVSEANIGVRNARPTLP